MPANKLNPDSGNTLYVYDIIDKDYGVSALGVIDAINNIKADTLNVRINSPGGDVFESRAIKSALRNFSGKKIAYIDGLCASAATSIALECDEIVMASDSFFMIHNAHVLTYGDKNRLVEVAGFLEKIEQAIVKEYTEKSGKPESEIVQMMNSETWMTAEDALNNGFVDSITETSGVKNVWNLSAYEKPPKALTEQPKKSESEIPKNTSGASTTNANRLKLLEIL